MSSDLKVPIPLQQYGNYYYLHKKQFDSNDRIAPSPNITNNIGMLQNNTCQKALSHLK